MNKNNNCRFNLITIVLYYLALIFLLPGCSGTGDTLKTGMPQTDAVGSPAAEKTMLASADNDHDGVINADDQCKNTLPDILVDIKGCALDTDGDTVADSRDACRGTPHGVKVDGKGCGFDDDRDGIPNYRDRCAGTIKDVSVDGNGCEWDTDNDGVVDSKDLCAGTPPGVKVEEIGCHIIEVVTLEGVHFRTGSDELSNAARTVLRNVANKLREHPRMRLEVTGHTDNTGSTAINAQLSLSRARAATRFLVELGVNKKVLATHGYGANQPVASNDTALGRTKNRRVELRFVEID